MAEFFEEQLFDVNLKEFATRVGYICSLENNSKLSAEDAYQEIKKLYKALKRSRDGLNIAERGDNRSTTD